MKPAVLQLIDSFDEGGSERQGLELTRLLHTAGNFEVFLATLNADGVLRKEISDLNLDPIPSYPLTSFYDANALKQLKLFAGYLRAKEIQVVHTHDFYTNIFGMAAAWLAGVKVRIASCRETAGMRTKRQHRLQRLAFKLAHRIVVNSTAVKDKLIAEGTAERCISVIHNGLNLARIQPAHPVNRAEALAGAGVEHVPNDIQHFVTIVANMRHEVKNYPMFLQAARRVNAAMGNVGFLLAGTGPLQPTIQELSRDLGLTDKTFFLGRCENVAVLLSASDVCVLTSKAEGFSNAILEYMAAGCPVVATDVGGAREAIVQGVTGYLVRSGDDETMAEHILRLLRDRELARSMGNAGRRRVEDNFSTTALLNNVEGLYQSLLSDQTACENRVARVRETQADLLGSNVR